MKAPRVKSRKRAATTAEKDEDVVASKKKASFEVNHPSLTFDDFAGNDIAKEVNNFFLLESCDGFMAVHFNRVLICSCRIFYFQECSK